MKTKITLILFLLIAHLSFLTSQVPQGFNYQAIARGSDGKEIANTTLQVKVSILSDTTGFYAAGTGTYIWEEQQSVKTNSLGLFTLTVGNTLATKIQGSAASFSVIDWKQQPLFIGTKINNSGWKNMGTSRLWSVPYAMNASNLSGPVEKLAVTGSTTAMDEALFEVKNKSGQTIFAVYNEGVRIYVDDGLAKGQGKGGFAIGSFGTAKAPSQEFFVVSPDSIRAYIGTNKALKGGFAIGGFSKAKAPVEEYLRVTRDSTRVYTNPTVAKGTKGGFAIGSFSPVKGPDDNYLNVTPSNYLIGQGAGKSLSTGLYNTFMGYQNGYFNTKGSQNVFIGYHAGYMNDTASYNVFIGNESGFSNIRGVYNAFVGYQAGKSNQTGQANTFIGNLTGTTMTTGNANTFVGTSAGQNFTNGLGNTFMGVQAGFGFLNGNYNVFIGSAAGAGYQFPVGATGGQNNVAVGTGAGYRISTGSNNIFLGNFSGVFNTSGSNNVFAGYQSGWSNSTGDFNTFLGYQGGMYNTTGYHNAFIGYQAGYTNSTGYFNLFLGDQSGYSNTTGFNNTFLGYQAGYTNSSGNWNVFIGNKTGYYNTTGVQNIFIGDGAGLRNTTGSQNLFMGLQSGSNNTIGGGNVFAGWNAGLLNTTGAYNAFFGLGAGYSNTTAYYNTYLGFSAGLANQTGQMNVLLGANAGRSNTAGTGNVVVGESAGYIGTSGNYNTIIGNSAAYNMLTGSSNVIIGSGAASNETNISNRLYIENSAADKNSALIYGEFDTKNLTFNGNVGIGKTSPATRLDIAGGNWNVAGASEGDFRIGNASYRLKIGVATGGGGIGDVRMTAMGGTNRIIMGGNGVDVLAITNTNVYPWTDNAIPLGLSTNRWSVVYSANGVVTTSDIRLKNDIQELSYGLESIMKLDPVSYTWKDGTDKNRKLGLIAQDVDKVISEVVDKGNDPAETLGINYSELVPVLIKGIQEQQKQIETTNSENRQLRLDMNLLREEVEKLKAQASEKGLK